jgi:hypothetical protein
VPQVYGEAKRDSALRFQFGEWDEQRRFDQVIWRVLRRRKLLRGRMQLPLMHKTHETSSRYVY